jgi:formylglycine-generating enzyme required for sulfatase activity
MENKDKIGFEIGDWKKLLQKLPGAIWEGLIEAAKSSSKHIYIYGFSLHAFGLGALRYLQRELKRTPQENLLEMAEGINKSSTEEIKAIFNELGFVPEKLSEQLADILKGVADNTELIKGIPPSFEDILKAISNIDTLKYLKEQADFEKTYLESVRKQYGYMEILGIPSLEQKYPIDAGFISLSLTGAGESRLPGSAESVLYQYPQLVIEGEAGAGKTTLLQWEAVRCCDQKGICEIPDKERGFDEFKRDREPSVIPFFIKLRRLVTENGDFPAFPDADRWINLSTPYLKMNPPENWIHFTLAEGRCLLILDGLDELPPPKRPKFWKELEGLYNLYPNLKFRVTSRYFPRDGKNADQWNPPPHPKTGNPTPTVRIEPLSPDRIDQLIDKWHQAVVEAALTPEARETAVHDLEGYADKLKGRIREPMYRRIFELAETPFLCAAVCLINRHRRQVLPKERHELYKMLIEALLSLRDKQREIHTVYDNITTEALVYLHACLAWDMMGGMKKDEEKKSYLIEAKQEDVLIWLIKYMNQIPSLRELNAAEFLDRYLITRCALIRQPVEGNLDFRHRALQEYLAGTAAIQLALIDQLVTHAHDDRWRDTVILAAGGYNVGKQDAIRLITELIRRGERERLNICFAVAVACLETASEKLDSDTYDLVLKKLEQLVPPRNPEEAKILSAAGDRVVEFLPYSKYKGDLDIAAACAETLSNIGSDDARAQLKNGFMNDTRIPIVIQLLKCPGFHPLRIPGVTGDANETHSLVIPEYALEYITDIKPLSGLTELRALSLRCCEKIGDISPIAELKKLEKLDLGYCIGIKDFSPLQELPNLKSLDLQGIDLPKDFQLPKSLPLEPKPGIDFLEITEGLYMKMVWIDGGDFLMGSPEGEIGRYDDEGPVHRVHLDGFWMASVPVTQRQYQSIIKDNPSRFKGEHNPVEWVTWNDAREFCAKLSEKTGREYTLPTEAQWEFACRAGSKGRFCFGDSDQLLEHYAWYDKNSEGKTHPVGLKRPNDWGVFDMHGNVWEWCLDNWNENYNKALNDGSAWISEDEGAPRVFRGGSWGDGARFCRSAYRYYYSPDGRWDLLGVRVCLQAGR